MEATLRPGLRVLQVGPLYVPHVRRWTEHAAALGCSVHAAGHIAPGRRLVDLTDVATGIDIEPDSLYGAGPSRRVGWLREVLRRVRPNVVHAHWLSTWGCFATAAASCPVVLTPWGSDVYLATGVDRRRGDWALAEADRVLARSRHMLDEILDRGAPAERTSRVDLGVDLERFRPPGKSERERLRHELGLPGGPVILSFRAGTPLYNLDVVLEAFRSLQSRLPGVTLVLAHGDAPLSAQVRSRLVGQGEAEGVRVVGAVPHREMPKYLRAATVGISIPSSDGSPNSVWEALGSGLPLVVSRLAQIDQRIGGSGAVRQVEPRAEQVASALHDLVADAELRSRMATAARDWALANVGEHEQIARLGTVYAGLAGGVHEAATGFEESPVRTP